MTNAPQSDTTPKESSPLWGWAFLILFVFGGLYLMTGESREAAKEAERLQEEYQQTKRDIEAKREARIEAAFNPPAETVPRSNSRREERTPPVAKSHPTSLDLPVFDSKAYCQNQWDDNNFMVVSCLELESDTYRDLESLVIESETEYDAFESCIDQWDSYFMIDSCINLERDSIRKLQNY